MWCSRLTLTNINKSRTQFTTATTFAADAAAAGSRGKGWAFGSELNRIIVIWFEAKN